MSDGQVPPVVVPDDFDEEAYLAANADVAAVVARGGLRSGREHYIHFGAFENRSLRPGLRPPPFRLPFAPHLHPSRRDKILASLDLPSLDGVEIGALSVPLVTPAEGRIFYVDYQGTEALRDHYRAAPNIDVSRIVKVDAIWGDRTLQACIGPERKMDYVVASHVIEHTPDLITWLGEVREILRQSGTLRLAIPDRRYTFDYLRAETRIHDVLDAYMRKARSPLPRAILDHHLNLVELDSRTAWDQPVNPAALPRRYHPRHAMALAEEAMRTGRYIDVHCWVFTPASFAALCEEMVALDLIDFGCHYWFDTPRHGLEFYVGMTIRDSKADRIASWRTMRAAVG